MSYFKAARDRACFLCAKLGIEQPVLNAPMTDVAGPELVAAVSEAGGLGVVPGADLEPDALIRFCESVRARTSRPFAVNLRPKLDVQNVVEDLQPVGEALEFVYDELGLDHWETLARRRQACFWPDYHDQFEAALAMQPAAMISSFGGFREPEADRLKALGIVHIGSVTTLREAKVLRAAGADALIVQGAEAGGPRLSFEDSDAVMMGLSVLVPSVARATGLPVIAAGGICGSAQAAGLAVSGASGFVLGTSLVPTVESRASVSHRWFAVNGSPDQTVMTRLFTGRLERIYRSQLADALSGFESRTASWPMPSALFQPLFKAAQAQDREELLAYRLGQSCGRSSFKTVGEAVASVSAWLVESR